MENTMSDPVFSSPPRTTHGKERRNPSITPRKFKRFFTPRSRVPSRVSSARRALQDLAAPDLNRKNNRYQTPAPSSPLGPLSSFLEETVEEEEENDFDDQLDAQLPKRRKLHHTPDSSPCRPYLTTNPSRFGLSSSSPVRSRLLSPIRSLHSSQSNRELESDESEDEIFPSPAPIKRLAPLTSRGFVGQLAQRELGGMYRASQSPLKIPTADWRMEVADFRTTSDDIHECNSYDNPGRCIPFCVTSCHKESLIAVGDEEGRVRLLDTSRDRLDLFPGVHMSFQAHTNAIIDLDFSADDLRLATASGDQTGRVVDIMTQTPIANLHHHTASLKQVRFQPGAANNSVLATSSRDGSVQIWDLRCTGKPVQNIPSPEDRQVNLAFRRPPPKEGRAVNSLYHAHARTSRQVLQAHGVGHSDMPSRHELPSRAGDVSVTCLQFLPQGKEHLLLTACEADASINLWDIRLIHTSRQKVASALSATAPPPSHQNWRPFGISSLALSTDGSRLYSTCKDNTVYAYSMPHLILGNATELSARNGYPPRRRNAATHQGLGPLYGFRHPSFHATSFYVKCDVRQARDCQSELLAVGSSDSCAVLFPTAERYFRDDLNGGIGALSLDNSTIATSRPDSSSNVVPGRSSGGLSLSNRPKDDIPIVRLGTPLIRAHESEVGALSWTNEGKLATVGDDFMVRLWSEDRKEARALRTGGEFGGKRWGCGWAEVGDDWDEGDDAEEEEEEEE